MIVHSEALGLCETLKEVSSNFLQAILFRAQKKGEKKYGEAGMSRFIICMLLLMFQMAISLAISSLPSQLYSVMQIAESENSGDQYQLILASFWTQFVRTFCDIIPTNVVFFQENYFTILLSNVMLSHVFHDFMSSHVILLFCYSTLHSENSFVFQQSNDTSGDHVVTPSRQPDTPEQTDNLRLAITLMA